MVKSAHPFITLQKIYYRQFFYFLFLFGGVGLGTSESKLISSNGVIASKIVKAHGVLQRVKPSEWWGFTRIWAPSSRPLL